MTTKLSDLREALERLSHRGWMSPSQDVIYDAARRFLHLTETGQREWRCELTRVTENGEVRGVLPGSQTWQECFERRIHQKSYSCGWALVIPVSDGGSET